MTRPAAGALLLAALLFCTACRGMVADPALLRQSWDAYRARFVTPDGRVTRPEHGGDTVSEGQAYTLLRAAWMDDRPTFDRVWHWTRSHLSRTNRTGATLMAWHWTPADGGRVDDWNVATDADTDVALALLMAADRWSGPAAPDLPRYDEAARAVLADLADHAVAVDNDGTRLMLPGTWADERAEGRGLVLNPSYFAPAAYRVFARVTGDARWIDLATGSYRVYGAVCRPGSPSRPIPDWVRWTSSASWTPEGNPARSSWDAIRVPWRVATDLLWFDAPDARRTLSACFAALVDDARRRDGGLAVERALDGAVVGADDHPLANAMFAMAAGTAHDRDRLLERVRARMVRGPSGLYFGEPDRYYVNSLAYLPFLARAGRYVAPGGGRQGTGPAR